MSSWRSRPVDVKWCPWTEGMEKDYTTFVSLGFYLGIADTIPQ